MKREILLMAMLALPASAADDTRMFLQFNPGSDRPSALWVGKAPSNIRPDVVMLPWAPAAGSDGKPDLINSNYALLDGHIIYKPQPVFLPPDLIGFERDVENDPAISDEAKLELSNFAQFVSRHPGNQAAVIKHWQALVKVNGSGWLDETVQKIAEGYAQKARILPAAQ